MAEKMKKLCAWMLIALLLGLCACGRQAVPEKMGATTVPIIIEATTEAPATTTVPVTIPIEYPASYKAAPAAYKPILDDLYRFVYLVSNDIETNDVYGETGIAEAPNFALENGEIRHGYVGYAIKDINRDGVPELLILTKDLAVFSWFTIRGDEPVHLAAYTLRVPASFAADGTIYVKGAGGIFCRLYSYWLDAAATELTLLTEYHMDSGDCCQVMDGERYEITEEEFYELQEQYMNPQSPMKFQFIPIEQ